jgi:uncharacterized ion transporter superfamily protein YfcC
MEKGMFANVMFIVYNGLSFFIPSSSGMAVLNMPIMALLADTAGVVREVVVSVNVWYMSVLLYQPNFAHSGGTHHREDRIQQMD